MPETKNKGGRPRKYPEEDKYARQKAYYERKKKKMKELEERVKKLQNGKDLSPEQKKILEMLDIPDRGESFWTKITPNEIALMGTQKLEQLASNLREITNINTLLKIQILNLIVKTINLDYLHSPEELSSKDLLNILNDDVESIINLTQESNQLQTLLYLLEAELDSRGRLDKREATIDLFEAKVEELEKQIKERKIKTIPEEKTSK
ncbi:MAG: hypothetical protein ACFFDS_04960 [Candidatus Thorarchaeota archaeon]